MSAQGGLIEVGSDGQMNHPKGTSVQRQVYRRPAPQGAGVYCAMDENGSVEIIGGPGAGSNIPFGNDTGAVNAIQVALPGATLTDDYTFEVRINHTNTGATTLQVNALGLIALTDTDGNPLKPGMIVAGEIYLFAYNLTAGKYELLGLSKPSFGLNVVNVDSATTVVYNVVGNEDAILVDTTTAPVQINLLAANSPAIVKRVSVKDKKGTDGMNNITVHPAGADTVDTVAGNVIMSIPFESLEFTSDGVSNYSLT